MKIANSVQCLLVFVLLLMGCSSPEQQGKNTVATTEGGGEDLPVQNKNLEVMSSRFYQLYQPFKAVEPDQLSDFIAEYGTEFLSPTLQQKLLKNIACEAKSADCQLAMDPFYAAQSHLVLESIKRINPSQVKVQFADKVSLILSYDCKNSCVIENVIYAKNDDLLSRLK